MLWTPMHAEASESFVPFVVNQLGSAGGAPCPSVPFVPLW
jgi:hypothetical protein